MIENPYQMVSTLDCRELKVLEKKEHFKEMKELLDYKCGLEWRE